MHNGMFTLIGSAGTGIASFFEYPYRDSEEHALSHTVRAMAYQGHIVINPAGDKCAYTSYNADIIHFYKLSKDSMMVISKIENAYPVYRPEENNALFVLNTVTGYTAISVTNKYVYALYCGKTKEELYAGNMQNIINARELRIFDWNGNLVKKYTLDVICRYISASRDDSKLWAVAHTPEITPVVFDLPRVNNYQQPQQEKGNTLVSRHTDVPVVPATAKPASETFASEIVKPAGEGESRMQVLRVGKIRAGEEAQFNMHLKFKASTYYFSGEGISIKDTLSTDGQNIISIRVKKESRGAFSNTVYISSPTADMQLLLGGEVE
jgi:hypothetical protein